MILIFTLHKTRPVIITQPACVSDETLLTNQKLMTTEADTHHQLSHTAAERYDTKQSKTQVLYLHYLQVWQSFNGQR